MSSENQQSIVEFRHVSFAIGGSRILDDINLQIEKGETLVLLGESGCGKTTTLKAYKSFNRADERRSFWSKENRQPIGTR